jgi:putative addiction module component (TIGR02574 family)
MTQTDLAKMPISEKIQLMESLWESLSNDPVATEVVPTWHGDVLAKRAVMLDQGQETVSAWGDAKQRIRDQTAKQ